jgi:Ca2+-binding EF-hand superfamily protein
MVQPDHARISGKSDSKGLTLEDFSALLHIPLVAYMQNCLRARFHLINCEDSGDMSYNDLRHCLTDLDSLLTIMELDEMMKKCDTNRDGIIAYEEFVAIRSVPHFLSYCAG